MDTSVLIVGQGLAGTLLAFACEKAGIPFILADEDRGGAASAAAAGILNPITGQRLVKTRNAEALFDEAEQVYGEIAQAWKCEILHPRPVWRVLETVEERLRFDERFRKGELSPFAHPVTREPPLEGCFEAPFGAFEIRPAAYLNLPGLLEAGRRWLRTTGRLRLEAVVAEDISMKRGRVQWKDIAAERVIFCDGAAVRRNRRFAWVPLQPVKGETLALRVPGFPADRIVASGLWFVQTANELVRAGATYAPDEIDPRPTPRARAELIREVERRLRVPFKVVGQQAGIRMATSDRRPVAGFHFSQSYLGIINGFGSKGALYAPALARQVAALLASDRPVDPEYDVCRFRREA